MNTQVRPRPDGAPAPVTAEVAAAAADHPTPTPSASRAVGLCVNCDNAATCRLRGVDGGVWYCEEYL